MYSIFIQQIDSHFLSMEIIKQYSVFSVPAYILCLYLFQKKKKKCNTIKIHRTYAPCTYYTPRILYTTIQSWSQTRSSNKRWYVSSSLTMINVFNFMFSTFCPHLDSRTRNNFSSICAGKVYSKRRRIIIHFLIFFSRFQSRKWLTRKNKKKLSCV